MQQMIATFFRSIRSALPKLGSLDKSTIAFAQSVLFTSVAITALLGGARQIKMLEPIELAAFDQMLRWRPDEGPDPRLLIVGITEGDIQRLKEWPISDRKMLEVLQKIDRLQPRVIGLDVLRDVPLGEGRDRLSQFLQTSDRIIGVCLVSDGTPENPGSPPPPGLSKKQIGFADFGVDPGGILRRALLFMKPPVPSTQLPASEAHLCNDPSQTLFSFNLQLALRYLQKEGVKPQLTSDKLLKIGSTLFKPLESSDGGYKNVDVRGYQLLINYRSSRQVAKQVTLMDILEGRIDPQWVTDRVVVIGYTTDTVKDFFYTPFSAGKQNDQSMPGAIAHAQVVSQILSTVLDKRPLFWFWPEWGELIWMWGWSAVGAIIALRIPQPLRFTVTSGATLAALIGMSFGLFLAGGWIPVAPPAIALVAAAGSILLVDRFNKGGYAKVITEKVKQVFKIEIDQAKKEKQVAEIVESEFFQELVQKKDRLKNPKREGTSEESSTALQETGETTEVEATETQTNDYLSQLRQKAKEQKQKQRGNQASVEQPLSNTPATETENQPTAEIENQVDQSLSEGASEDVFGDLRAKAQRMKQRRSGPPARDGQIEKPEGGKAD